MDGVLDELFHVFAQKFPQTTDHQPFAKRLIDQCFFVFSYFDSSQTEPTPIRFPFLGGLSYMDNYPYKTEHQAHEQRKSRTSLHV